MLATIKLLPIGVQLGLAAAVFVVVTGAATGVYFHIRNAGYAAAIEDVAQRNKVAINAVRKATTKVTDCYAGGGSWDATRGVCD